MDAAMVKDACTGAPVETTTLFDTAVIEVPFNVAWTANVPTAAAVTVAVTWPKVPEVELVVAELVFNVAMPVAGTIAKFTISPLTGLPLVSTTSKVSKAVEVLPLPPVPGSTMDSSLGTADTKLIAATVGAASFTATVTGVVAPATVAVRVSVAAQPLSLYVIVA